MATINKDLLKLGVTITRCDQCKRVEVVYGKWIDELYNWHCDQCDKWLRIEDGTAHMNYCPNCGAKMDVEIE